MRTRAEHGRRGQDTQLFRSDWHPDEVGVCLALAAVWDRVEQAARRELLRPVFAALGEGVPPDVGDVEVWREMPWVTPGGAQNQRQDLVLVLRGWGTLLVEAKVSQAYWAQSGPAKLPEYARELRRRLDAGHVHGPNGAVVALTPAPVPARELNGGEGIRAGGLTWSAISRAAGALAGDEKHPVAQALVPELLHILARRGLDAPLQEIDAAMLTTIAASLEALDQIVPALDRYLSTLAREATAFGLQEAEIIQLAEQSFRSGSFRRPNVSWDVDAPGRRNTFVAVVVDLGAGKVRFLVGVQFDDAPPADLLASLVGNDPPGEDVEVHVWSPDRLVVAPATADGAAQLDALPGELGTDNWEWRGLGFSVPLEGVDGAAFGTGMLQAHLDLLRTRLPPLARRVLRSDLPASQARPPLSAVLDTVAAWPPKANPQFPRALSPMPRPYDWTPDTVVDAWCRLLVDQDGIFHATGPKWKKWQVPLTSKGLYRSTDGVRCCGVRINAGKTGLRTRCPVCQKNWYNKEIREAG